MRRGIGSQGDRQTDLLGSLDLLIELCVMKGKTTVDGERLERFLVDLGEHSAPFVDHLDHPDHAK